MILRTVFLLFLSYSSSINTYGLNLLFDTSQSATYKQFTVLKLDGFKAVAFRAYTPVGGGFFDFNVCGNAISSAKANLTNVIYMTPSPTRNASEQVQEMNSGLRRCNLAYKKFWLQVVRAEHWTNNVTRNVEFIKDVFAEANKNGQSVGIYTSSSEWQKITNDFNVTTEEAGPHPLWYWSRSTDATYNDFKPFGAWNSPFMKQFDQSASISNIMGNKNIYNSEL